MLVSKKELVGMTTVEKLAVGVMCMLAALTTLVVSGIALRLGGNFLILMPVFAVAAWLILLAHRCFQATEDTPPNENVVSLDAEHKKILGDAVLKCERENPLFRFILNRFM